MFPTIDKDLLELASSHLSKDPVLAPVIVRAGLCRIEPHGEYYRALVDSIIGQQLSVKAAANIKRRFRELFGDSFPRPEEILNKSIEELRTVGLSGQKAGYIRDLTEHIVDGKVKFDRLDRLSNEEIITELTDVKGIGEWTVHMFLMFCMGRPDVLAYGDLGVRTGIKNLYNLKALPSAQEVKDIAAAKHWHPYETIACWYVWFSLDNKPM